MLFDSHVHFDTVTGEHGIAALIGRAIPQKVGGMLAVGGNPLLNSHAVTAARRYPDTVRAAIGWDRDQALETRIRKATANSDAMFAFWSRQIARCRAIGVRICALGELGLDYHYSAETAARQQRLLRLQLAAARALRLPVIIHSRNAEADTLRLLEEHREACHGKLARHPGVVHCFSGSSDFAARLLDMDFSLGISGIVTFVNADDLRRTAQKIPHARLLIETDTPYLAPAPFRGKRNEPALLPAILRRLADIRGESAELLAAITSANAQAIFTTGLPAPQPPGTTVTQPMSPCGIRHALPANRRLRR